MFQNEAKEIRKEREWKSQIKENEENERKDWKSVCVCGRKGKVQRRCCWRSGKEIMVLKS